MNNTTEGLMAGKRGLIIGVANDHSIAWGIASRLAEEKAELAFTYQDDAFKRRVVPLAESVGSDIVMPCDVAQRETLEALFDHLKQTWGSLDFVVHAVAYADKQDLRGRYIDTSREGFRRSMHISCYSFTDIARRASELMTDGGTMVTLTYLGAEKVMPNYNVMGVAKAALEASVRYLAVDLGRDNIRVNAISAGPMRTLAGSAIGAARYVYNYNRQHAPLRRNVALEEVGSAGLYLLSDLSSGVTGEVLHVDCGFHALGIPAPENSSS